MRLSKLLGVIVILFTLLSSISAADFKTIYNRMYLEYLFNPSPTSVEDILYRVKDNGSFNNIDYSTKEGTPRSHLSWITSLAAAYNSPENKYYKSAEVSGKYLSALKFWVDTDHKAGNWWFRYIAYPKELSKSVVLMKNEIQKDKDLFDKTMKYLRFSYETAKPDHMTGANACDIIMGSMAASVMTENHEQLLEYQKKMTQLISIQDFEGISPDYMYGQHCGTGRQLYIASYGKEYINSTLYYIEFTNKTEYSTPGASLIEDHYINGIQWVFFSKNYDPNQSGRFNNSDKFYGQFESMTNRVLKLNTERKAEMKKVYDRIKGENSLSGNRMFWRFDYMVNRRPNYMVSTRMSSTRTVGAEAGNGDGEFNFYNGSGTNYIFFTGKEYGGDYFKKFNYRQFPGTTAEQDNQPLPVLDWGAGGLNGDAYAGGVSDSTYGTCGMILNKRNLSAHKSWFYFDDEFVCLGAGINQNNGTAPVFTNINQTNASGNAQYSAEEKIEKVSGNVNQAKAEWILHGKIGYFNLNKNASFELFCDTNLFVANINHGVNPQNQTYAYIVKPGVQSTGDAKKYVKNIPVSIISNTTAVQAARHNVLQISQAMFYQSGTLNIGEGKSISTDQPCAVIWKENTGTITVSNPRCESENPENIQLTIDLNGKKHHLTAKMPSGVYAGRSVTLYIK